MTRYLALALATTLLCGSAAAQTVAPPTTQPEPKLATAPTGTPPRDAASAALDGRIDHDAEFAPLDRNGDGWLSAAEVNGYGGAEPVDYAALDADGDGQVTPAEWTRYGDGQDPALQDAQDR